MPLVTISASYGAGGSQIGPQLARRLGVPFLDRAIPVAVAERLAVPLSEAIAHDEAGRSAFERLLERFAPAAQAFSASTPPPELLDERSYLTVTEEVIREHAARGDAVVLGRAAAVVLRDVPNALHVRLDGPRDRRLEHAMRLEGIDRETAERHARETDRAREAYVRQFYDVDARDLSLYHLVLDSTALALETCVDLIAVAAAAHAERTS
ncbi:MAG TPA: cytidylate kinase-like family protein [Solirubrobacteraceae bacterium]